MQIYILGPIHLNGEGYIPLYKRLLEECKKYCDTVLAPYPDFWDSKESPQEFYRRTVGVVQASNILIAEVTNPSTGVGMELQMAQDKNIPCIAICKKGHEPSKTVKGLPCLRQIIYYVDLDDLVDQLTTALKETNF